MELPVDYTKLPWRKRKLVREEYVRIQGGNCMHCNTSLNAQPPKHITSMKINWRQFPSNFLDNPVHLQHCHDSGMTEGAVHAYCNAVLWQYYGR